MIVLSCPQMQPLAAAMAAAGGRFSPGEVAWGSFPDGYPRLKIIDSGALRGRDVVFLASFDTPGEIFRQLSVLYEIPRYAVRTFKVVLPYYPTGTMERVEEEGQIATAASLARMLSLIPMTMSGPAQILVYDIHALQERFYFSDQVIPRLETAVPLLRARLAALPEAAVAFPDEGAVKRFGRMLSDHPQIVCRKVRKDGGREVKVEEGDPAGRHVVILDDLVQSGGTLLSCAAALRRAGAEAISVFVSHGVFPGESWRAFESAGIHRFWLTDSCPATAAAVSGREPFEVLSLAPLILEAVSR